MKFQLKFLPRLLELSSFNKSRPTAIYIHGYLASGINDASSTAIRSAYVQRNDHNILTFDWSFYSRQLYGSFVVPQLNIVISFIVKPSLMIKYLIARFIKISESFAIYLKAFLETGYDIKNLHLVGHSLG